MEITREALEKRLAALRESLDRSIGSVNVCNGAIKECEYWLAELAKEAHPSGAPNNGRLAVTE